MCVPASGKVLLPPPNKKEEVNNSQLQNESQLRLLSERRTDRPPRATPGRALGDLLDLDDLPYVKYP